MKRKISRYIIIFLFMLFLQYSTILNVKAIIASASDGAETELTGKDETVSGWDSTFVGLKVGVVSGTGSYKNTYLFLNKEPNLGSGKTIYFSQDPRSKSKSRVDATHKYLINGRDDMFYTYYIVNFSETLPTLPETGKKIEKKILEELPDNWIYNNKYINMNQKLNNGILDKIIEEIRPSHEDYILVEPMVLIKSTKHDNRYYYGTAFELMNNTTDNMIPGDYLIDCTVKSKYLDADDFCKKYTKNLLGGYPKLQLDASTNYGFKEDSSNEKRYISGATTAQAASGLLTNTLYVSSGVINYFPINSTTKNAGVDYPYPSYTYTGLTTTVGNWKNVHKADAPEKYAKVWDNETIIRNQCLKSKSCPEGIGLFRYINACAADFENKADNTMATRVGLYMKWGKRSLLNLNITDPIQACTDAPVSTETTRGCFYGGVNAKPNSFDESNLSGYNDIYYYQSKGILGFCMTTFNMNGNNYLKFKDGFAQENYQTALAFSGNAGQLLFVGRDKSMSTAAMVTINKSCYMFSTEDNENYSTVTGTDYYRNSIATKGDGGKMYIVENPAYNDGTSRTQLSIDVSDSNSESPLYNDYVAIGVTNTMVQDNEEYSDLELKDDAEAETEMDYGKAQLTNQIRRLALYRNEENKNLYTSGDISFYLNFPQAIAKKDNGAFVPYYNKLRADSNTYAGDNKTVRSKIIKEAEDGHYIYDLSYENLTNNIDFKNYIQKNYDESNTTLDLYGAISSPYDYRFIGYGIPTKLHIPEEDLSGRLNVNVKFRRFEFNINSDEGEVGVNEVEEDASGYCLYGLDNQILTPEFALEFRIIDTKNPFPGRNGTGRTVGNNWCYEDETTGNLDCTSTDSNEKIKTHITDANNSYNKNKDPKPKYTIELDPETIKEIRTYNKDNPYDDYTIKKNESTGKITSNFLEKHYINIEI